MSSVPSIGGLLDRDQLLRSNVEISNGLGVELVNGREAPAIVPQKLYEPQLA